MSKRIVTARRAKVTANSITKPEKHRETGTHNAQRLHVEGDVEVEVISQYPNGDGNPERPPEGTVIKGDNADMTAREVHPQGEAGGRRTVRLKDNVKVILREISFGRSRR